MRILITGAAGFIGMHLSKAYLSKNNIIYGIDNISSSYDKNLKLQRLRISHLLKLIFHLINSSKKFRKLTLI